VINMGFTTEDRHSESRAAHPLTRQASEPPHSVPSLENREGIRRVFISWSGNRAVLLRRLYGTGCPMVVQHVEPWMSEEDIESGGRSPPN
jgi:hypothetical protein